MNYRNIFSRIRCMTFVPVYSQKHAISFYWITKIFNAVDQDRIKQVGPNLTCAEWLLKNGASVRFKGNLDFVSDYNHLMNLEDLSESSQFCIEEVYAKEVTLTAKGFEHFKNCNDILKMTFINCPLNDKALLMLANVKNSLQILEMRSCFSIKDAGILSLTQLRVMEAAEGGDDLGEAFLADGTYMVHGDELEDDVDGNLSAENTDDDVNESKEKVGVPLREQDRFLPIANVAKIMKKAVPELGKIAKDARECVQECVSEFISFITSEASDRCHMEKRKTINGEDILFAMTTLGFDNYVEPLKIYLQKYREVTKGERSTMDDVFENKVFSRCPLHKTFLNSGVMADGSNSESIIYTYPEQMQQFQLT